LRFGRSGGESASVEQANTQTTLSKAQRETRAHESGPHDKNIAVGLSGGRSRWWVWTHGAII